jgi:hypothetical protein
LALQTAPGGCTGMYGHGTRPPGMSDWALEARSFCLAVADEAAVAVVDTREYGAYDQFEHWLVGERKDKIPHSLAWAHGAGTPTARASASAALAWATACSYAFGLAPPPHEAKQGSPATSAKAMRLINGRAPATSLNITSPSSISPLALSVHLFHLFDLDLGERIPCW